jgi:hypothetical protein
MCATCRRVRKDTYARHKAKRLAKAAEYRAKNPGKEKADRAAHYLRNREHNARVTAAYTREHPEVYAEAQSRRRTRTPPWVKPADTRVFYDMAKRVSRCLRLPFEVDHIVPLQGATVSGLHVPLNLRVIPRTFNRRKSSNYLEL